MTRAIDHATFTQARELTWTQRWEQARNTWSAQDTLYGIALEAVSVEGWTDAAQWFLDAGDDADLVYLLEGTAQAEAFERQCEAYQERTGKDWTDSAELCAIERDIPNLELGFAAAWVAGRPALNAGWL